MVKIGQIKPEEAPSKVPKTLSKKEKKQLDRRKKKTDKVQTEKKKQSKATVKDSKGDKDKKVLALGSIAMVVGVALFVGQNFIIPIFAKQDGMIFVATEEITSGTLLEPEMLQAVEMDSESILPSMIVNAEDLDGYAARTIREGEPLLAGAVSDALDEEDLNEYLYTSVVLNGTPVLQDGAMVQVYVRSGSNVTQLFDGPKRVYSNSNIGDYEVESDIVENPNLLLTDEEFEAYQEALANENIIVAARLYPERIPGGTTTTSGSNGEAGAIDVASLSDSELADVVLTYLNGLTAEESQTIPGIDETQAANLYAVVEQGGFASVNDLSAVEGFDESSASAVVEYALTQLEEGTE